jgi:catechol 2,3-dioxygenase-like lactoylglutathione lyase family enzyme
MQVLEFRFAFHARNFEASVAFYRDVLGMSYVGGWDRADGKGALLAAGDKAIVEIFGAAEGKTTDGPAPAAVNLALRLSGVTAVDEFYRKLSTAGANVAGSPENRAWGHRSFVVYDPDGIPVHIYCEVDDA